MPVRIPVQAATKYELLIIMRDEINTDAGAAGQLAELLRDPMRLMLPEASAGPIMVTLAAVIRVADSQPREVTRLGCGHVGECSAATGDCAGRADCSVCRVRNDGPFGHACGRARSQ